MEIVPATSDGQQPRYVRRPMVEFFLAISLGAALVQYGMMPGWLSAIAIPVVLAIVLWRAYRGRASRVWLLIALTLVSSAWLSRRMNDGSAESLLAQDVNQLPILVKFRGTVSSEPTVRPRDLETTPYRYPDPRSHQLGEFTRFSLDVAEASNGDRWQSITGTVSVWLDGEVPEVGYGDTVEVLGHLSAPWSARNEGEFDFKKYLAERGIFATVRVELPSVIRKLAGPGQISLVGIRSWVRQRFAAILDASLPSETAPLAEALVLGDRSRLGRTQLKPYLEGGTIHLLVVSGMQVGVLAWLLWHASAALIGPVFHRSLLVMVVLIGYCFLTGSDAPVVRATLVSILFLLGLLLGRGFDPINGLGLAAVVLYFVDPVEIFRPGPQLSFLCVLAILTFAPVVDFLMNWLMPRPTDPADFLTPRPPTVVLLEVLLRTFAVSMSVWLVTAPLVAHHFHLFAPISVLVSILMIPASGLALGLVSVVLVLGGFSTLLASVLGTLTGWVLAIVDATVRQSSELRGAFYLFLDRVLIGRPCSMCFYWCLASYRAQNSTNGSRVLLS